MLGLDTSGGVCAILLTPFFFSLSPFFLLCVCARQSLKIPLLGLASSKAIGRGLGHLGLSGFGMRQEGSPHSRWQVVWTLGEVIPESLHASLSWEPLKPLFEGELVAVQASSRAQNQDQQQTYAIARVAQSTKPKIGTAFVNVELEVQPGSFTIAKSSDIRVFRSTLSKGQGQDQDQDQSEERNRIQPQARNTSKQPQGSSSSGGGDGESASSALDDPEQETAASGRDIASAISDIMVNVGLRSLTPDAKDLLEESLELKRELESARELSEALSTKIDSLKAELEEHESKSKCQICYAQNIRVALVPCGHTLCDQCERNATTKCPFCRARVQQRQVLFT